MEDREDSVLLVPETIEIEPSDITPEEGKAVAKTLSEFITSYSKKGEGTSDEDWLLTQFKVSMPDRDEEELTRMRDEIIEGVRQQEEAKKSLNKALSRGMSRESWFANECKKATSGMSAEESAKYLQMLDDNIVNTNQEWRKTLIAKTSGQVNQNPSLDGFIAEEWHAQTFNANAAAKGSKYHAVAVKPDGTRYRENSVDIKIIDTQTGETVRKYQVKYYKNAKATGKAFDAGDYNGQRKLVAADQKGQVKGRHTEVIESPDGITSTPLTKQGAKELQQEAQSGNWQERNWNEYATKDIAVGIAKKAAKAGAMGAAIGTGFELGRQILNGEEIDGGKLIEEGLKSGADFGIKTAVAGGLKTAAEKGFLKSIAKGTPAGVFTNIAFVAIEDTKVLWQMGTGELTVAEGYEKIERTTVSSLCGLAVSAAAAEKGSALGALAGTVLGPIGSAVGGFVGGVVGYIAGSGVSDTAVRGLQKVRSVIIEDVVKPLWEGVKTTAKAAWEGFKSIFA